ncbi:general substrate transporter [Laetiporus sulphureus 93-53]|uniref:General substrate transporter n=1 Tax=Laetiporus sulphureus 93-53 TaxID=1314785 RepID=A0A165CW97_9APHY|nr:general substrate transporter [Laetiporus sulphureus 93-53]KZT03566.1 general substrate transporter [Laetiporus sulphureus 93-53]
MASVHEPQAFTTYGWIACIWILIVSFQYGYHISSLNQIQAVLTCRNAIPESPTVHYGLPACIPMSDATFSVLTSVYTVGGLIGSLGANLAMDRWGRKGACRVSALATAVGAGIMGISASLTSLILGRMLTGIGAGVGLCVGPIFLSEITPPKMRGAIGVLTQFAIVIGIMTTQAMGLQLATPRQWRIVLLFSTALAASQLFVSSMMVESPTWLNRHGLLQEKDKVARRLWKSGQIVRSPDLPTYDSEDPLLNTEDADEDDQIKPVEEHAISVPQLLVTPDLRRPLTIICFSMLVQQLSGVNAVLYYSNDILSKALPDLGPYVSLGITIVNTIMTAAPIFLIDRLGRKQLLSMSAGGALLSLFGVGFGLDSNLTSLASISILAFVASFAIGIGPVPFVMIPEVSPRHAVSALSSVALSLNWIANFIVGLVFLPLRNLLAQDDPDKEGRVFYVFAAMLALCTFVLFRVYRG